MASSSFLLFCYPSLVVDGLKTYNDLPWWDSSHGLTIPRTRLFLPPKDRIKTHHSLTKDNSVSNSSTSQAACRPASCGNTQQQRRAPSETSANSLRHPSTAWCRLQSEALSAPVCIARGSRVRFHASVRDGCELCHL